MNIFLFVGQSPYGNVKARELPAKLKGGYRLKQPEQCDDRYTFKSVLKTKEANNTI